MSSEALKRDTVDLPTGIWAAYRREANSYLPLREKSLSEKTVMELVNGPFVIRFDLQRHGKVYFIGLDDDLYRKLTSEGKQVRWLHDLFQGIQDKLKAQGLPEATSLYRWTISQIWGHQAGPEVFQGARVKEVRE